MKITTLDRTVGDLLKEFLFIPRFQRPYDWDKEQVEQLWMDTLVDNSDEYFIGSIVLYRQADSFGIVDGQQRITTILMMLCAIRDAFDEHGLNSLAEALQTIIEKVDIDNKKRFVLLTETSHPYLQDVVLARGKHQMEHDLGAEEEVIKQTFELLKATVTATLPADTGTRGRKAVEKTLKAQRDRLLNLKVITVELDNEDDAYLIFETLNTRGKELQVSHLLKNLLSRLWKPHNKNLDPLKLKWADLLGTFEVSQVDIGIDEFLHHFWLSTREKYITATKLFASIKKEITTSDEAKSLIEALCADAKLYRSIIEPSSRKWKKEELHIRRSLDAFAVFRLRQPFPLVLSIMRAYRDGGISKKNTESLLWAIERFHFAFTAVSSKSSSGGLSLMYAAWARALYEADDEKKIQASIRNVTRGLADRHPSKDDFVAGFKDLRLSDTLTKQRRLVRYVLEKVADHFAKAGVALDHGQMTIEHVASQNPEGEAPVSGDHLAMIGNLLWCDTELQDKLKNKPFSAKKAILKAHPIPGSEAITEKDEWGEDEIDERTSALSTLAYEKIWSK
jgi:uncharacterized protein DUF262/uncharacterized protein DUF1524